jgi:hypothetical protein
LILLRGGIMWFFCIKKEALRIWAYLFWPNRCRKNIYILWRKMKSYYVFENKIFFLLIYENTCTEKYMSTAKRNIFFKKRYSNLYLGIFIISPIICFIMRQRKKYKSIITNPLNRFFIKNIQTKYYFFTPIKTKNDE